MRLVNHALTGVAIGLSFDNPATGFSLGVASHFMLDAIPHFGAPWLHFKAPVGRVVAVFDCAAALGVAIAAAVIWPQRLLPLTAAVLGAVLPDLLYIPYYLMNRHFWDRLFWFHSVIQTERLWGIVSEVPWAVMMLIVIRAYH